MSVLVLLTALLVAAAVVVVVLLAAVVAVAVAVSVCVCVCVCVCVRALVLVFLLLRPLLLSMVVGLVVAVPQLVSPPVPLSLSVPPQFQRSVALHVAPQLSSLVPVLFDPSARHRRRVSGAMLLLPLWLSLAVLLSPLRF